MAAVIKTRSNGSVVSLKARESSGGIFVTRMSPGGGKITSLDRKVYATALASAKESLRKKADVTR